MARQPEAEECRGPTIPGVRGESGARDLAIAVGVVVGLSRFAPDPFVWPIAVVLLAAVFLGALQILAEADPAAQGAGVPVESLILPAAAAIAVLGVVRLVPSASRSCRVSPWRAASSASRS